MIEGEVLRLFRDLHVSDPLFRKTAPGRFFRGHGLSSSSSASSSAGLSRYSSRASTGSFASTRTPSRFPLASPPRQVHVTENDIEEDVTEGMDDGNEEYEEPEPSPSLEEVLQTEAEALATELEQAANDGIEEELLDGLESTVESGAEALVSMQEARSKLQQVRKDRGYQGPATSAPAGTQTVKGGQRGRGLGQTALRKQSGKHPCYDCGQHGHWAGDPECPKPGQGLFRKPASI